MKRAVNLKLMRPVASWGGEDGLLVGLCSATWCRWCGLVVAQKLARRQVTPGGAVLGSTMGGQGQAASW